MYFNIITLSTPRCFNLDAFLISLLSNARFYAGHDTVKAMKMASLISRPPVTVGHTFTELEIPTILHIVIIP